MPGRANAWCGSWNPALTAAANTYHPSASVNLAWTSTGPAGCGNNGAAPWPGTDHLELHANRDSTTPPSAPNGATKLASFDTVLEFEQFVHRSDMDMAYGLFACAQAGNCNRYYGNTGSESNTGNTATASTVAEIWELKLIEGENDLTHFVVGPGEGANAPRAFMYPSTWSSFPNTMALFYSNSPTGGNPSQVWYTRYWHDDWSNFNTGDWEDPVLVGVGATSLSDEDYKADHPWFMLTEDSGGGDQSVELFVQSQRGNDNSTYNDQIMELGGSAIGDDYGAGCGTSTCTDTFLDQGYVAIEADDTSSTWYLHDALHGGVVWDYIADPILTQEVDAPVMFFNMAHPSADAGACAGTGTDDDIGRVDGSWDTMSGTWLWEVQNTADCPTIQVEDGHDNSVVPLPQDEYKMYYKTYTSPQVWKVIYWDGVSWGDERDIEFVWDSETVDGPDDECVDNISALVWIDGTTPVAGMFFRLADSDDPACDGVGIDESDPFETDTNDSIIAFAELAN